MASINCPRCGSSISHFSIDVIKNGGTVAGGGGIICPSCGRQIPNYEIEDIVQSPLSLLSEIRARSKSEEKKKCFIATAAYGSAYMPEVLALQQFRDMRLARTQMGRLLVRFYEWCSPSLAQAIEPHPSACWVVRSFVLAPIVWLIRRTM